MPSQTIRFDFFFRTERPDFTAFWGNEANLPWTASLHLPADTTLAGAMAAATEARLFGKGSHRAGCFEIQNDLGIYALPGGARRNIRYCLDAVVFKTWDELENEELEAVQHHAA